jgi:hypothetical protein
MKSGFLIFTLFLALMCIGGASTAMAQSVTGTGVFFQAGSNNAPVTVTVSAQQGGNGGVIRFGEGQTQIIAHPVDICVQGNSAYVVGEITHSSGDFAGAEGQFFIFGFQDNGKDGDFALPAFVPFIPFQVPACELAAVTFPVPLDRGSYQVKQ